MIVSIINLAGETHTDIANKTVGARQRDEDDEIKWPKTFRYDWEEEDDDDDNYGKPTISGGMFLEILWYQ